MNTLKSLLVVLCMFCWISNLAFAGNLVVPVAPPNGTDDTATIEAALDACVAYGPGCTVQLAAGTYLIKQLFAQDFHGTFMGKGMDVTILQALPNLEVSQEIPVWSSPPTAGNKYPMLVLFFGGDIKVSDMTIKALEMNPLAGWYDYEGQAEPFTWMWSILEFMGESTMNAVVTRVALEGVYGENQPGYDHYNSQGGLAIDPYPPIDFPTPGYLSGIFRVSASRFDTLGMGIYIPALHNARLTIGGSPSEANLMRNCEMGPVFADLDSSFVDCSYNDVGVVGPGALSGIFVLQRWVIPVETPSTFLIQHNNVKATGSAEDGIWVIDFAPLYGEPKTANILISQNKITLEAADSGIAGDGIESVLTEGTIISNNRIVGIGYAGIGIWGDTQAMVKANDVDNVTAEVYPARISLQNFDPVPVNNCTVVGFGNRTNVYDEGVNNTIVGVNNMQGNPPGPAIRDAMKRKMEMIKSMRKF
jgi:hypothetical protein